MDLLARLAFLASAARSQQESTFSQVSDSRKLDVTCLLTDIAYSMGDENSERMGWDDLAENMKYIMHGNHVDSGGKMYVVGTSTSSELKAVGTSFQYTDAVAMRIDEDGILNWFTSMGKAYNDYPGGITVEGTSFAYVIGTSEDADELRDIFIVKLARSTGALEWKKQYGRSGSPNYNERGLSIDYYSDNLYGAGTMYFDSSTARDGIIFKVNTDGVF